MDYLRAELIIPLEFSLQLDRFLRMLYGLFTDFTDDIRAFGQRFLYRHRIQLFLLCVLALSLYADLPISPDDHAL